VLFWPPNVHSLSIFVISRSAPKILLHLQLLCEKKCTHEKRRFYFTGYGIECAIKHILTFFCSAVHLAKNRIKFTRD